MSRWAILVIWYDGEEEYLRHGVHSGVGPGGSIAQFPSRAQAEEQAKFMRMGMEGEVQSINVVEAPDA